MSQITAWVSKKQEQQLQKTSDELKIPMKYIAGYILVYGMKDICYIKEKDEPTEEDQEVAIIACPPLQGTDPITEINMNKLIKDIKDVAIIEKTTMKNIITKAMRYNPMISDIINIKKAMKTHRRIQ